MHAIFASGRYHLILYYFEHYSSSIKQPINQSQGELWYIRLKNQKFDRNNFRERSGNKNNRIVV